MNAKIEYECVVFVVHLNPPLVKFSFSLFYAHYDYCHTQQTKIEIEPRIKMNDMF